MTRYSLPPLLSLICFIFLAVLVLVRKNRDPAHSLFFLLCLTGIILQTDILILFSVKSREVALWSSRIDHLFVVYAIPLFMHFFHVYLKINRRKWLIYAAYAGAFFMMWFALTPLCIQEMLRHEFGFFGKGGPLYPLIGFGAACASIYSLFILGLAIRREKNSVQKNKLKYILAGFGVMGFLNGLNVLPLLGYPFYPPGTFSFIPLIVFGVGLFRYDLLDMGIIIQKSLLYSILTICLTSLYALAVTASNQFLYRNAFADTLGFQISFFLLVVMVFGPLQSRVQAAIASHFQREITALKASMSTISGSIAAALDASAIANALLTGLTDSLQVCHCALYLKDTARKGFRRFASQSLVRQAFPQAFMPKGSSLVKRLQAEDSLTNRQFLMETTSLKNNEPYLYDMDKLWAEVVLPLKVKGHLIGFIVVGQKKSRNLFGREETSLLLTLASQVSLALENARTYRQLARLNQHLEEKVQERTVALKMALTNIKLSQERLVRSESLAAIGQLVAGVSHEINNPISAALSLIQSIQDDVKSRGNLDWETIQNDIAYSLKALGRVKKIVGSLLCLSRQTDSYAELVDLNEIVQDALQVLDNQIQRAEIQIETNFQCPIPSVRGNFAQLGQVAVNIIQNACQSINGQSGSLFLATCYRPKADRVVFSCRDNGPGINPSIERDVFKPFFTTKPAGEGTGLGLYISHEIVRKHQGRIRHENMADGGTLFEVLLPAA